MRGGRKLLPCGLHQRAFHLQQAGSHLLPPSSTVRTDGLWPGETECPFLLVSSVPIALTAGRGEHGVCFQTQACFLWIPLQHPSSRTWGLSNQLPASPGQRPCSAPQLEAPAWLSFVVHVPRAWDPNPCSKGGGGSAACVDLKLWGWPQSHPLHDLGAAG